MKLKDLNLKHYQYKEGSMEFIKLVTFIFLLSSSPVEKGDIEKALVGKWESVLAYEVYRPINIFKGLKFEELKYQKIKKKVTLEFTQQSEFIFTQGKKIEKYKFKIVGKDKLLLTTLEGKKKELIDISFKKTKKEVIEEVEFFKDKTTENIYGFDKVKK